jgi:hypothetical protein
MSMPAAWVDRLFARMVARYGNGWGRMWEGINAEIVRADWAEQLDGLTADAILYGLEHLPLDWPPTASRFRAICIERRADEPVLALPAPPADPAKATAALSAMREIGRPKNGPKAWAYRLRDREQGGERLTLAQRTMWRAAIDMEGKPPAGGALPVPPAQTEPRAAVELATETQ